MRSEIRDDMLRTVMEVFTESIVDGRLHLTKLVPEIMPFLAQRSFNSADVGKQIRRILVIRLEEIGDLVLGSAFLRELRRNQPFAHITLLVKPECENLVEFCPYVNEILIVRTWVRGTNRNAWEILHDIVEFSVDVLWKHSYDICLVPRYDDDYYCAGLLGLLSGAPIRVGFSESATPWKAERNRGFDALYSRVLPAITEVHEVERNLSMISSLGGKIASKHLEYWTGAEDELWAAKQARSFSSPHVAMAIGLPSDCRHWPVDRYAAIAKWIDEEYDMGIILLGSPGEAAISSQLTARSTGRVVDFTGKTTLRQAAALLRYCQFYLGRDTGIMHIAAAAGIPVLEISPHNCHGDPQHSLSCERYGPWGVPAVLVRPEFGLPPCYAGCFADKPHCIEQIAVEQVKQGVRELYSLAFGQGARGAAQ